MTANSVHTKESVRNDTHQFTSPFVADASAFVERFDETEWVTPADEAMAATIEWFALGSQGWPAWLRDLT